MLTFEWTKSTHSGPAGHCVEVRQTATGVQVRDSKAPDGDVLTFTDAEWSAFTGGARDGEFDLDR